MVTKPPLEVLGARMIQQDVLDGILQGIKGCFSQKVRTVLLAGFLSSIPLEAKAQESYGEIPCSVVTQDVDFRQLDPEMEEYLSVLRCNTQNIGDMLYTPSREDFEIDGYAEGEAYEYYISIIQSEAYKKMMYPVFIEIYVQTGITPTWKMQLIFANLFLAFNEKNASLSMSIMHEIIVESPNIPVEHILTKAGMLTI